MTRRFIFAFIAIPLFACIAPTGESSSTGDTESALSRLRFMAHARACWSDVSGTASVVQAPVPPPFPGGAITIADAELWERPNPALQHCRRNRLTPFWSSTQCMLQTCEQDFTDVSAHRDVGPVTIEGGTKSFELVPAEDGTYERAFEFERMWTGGERIEFSFPGVPGEVAPARTTVVAPPADVALVEPMASTLVRSAGLVLEWTGADAPGADDATLSVYLNGSESAPIPTSPGAFLPAQMVWCTTDLERGRIRVPASALERLPAGDATVSVQVEAREGRFANVEYVLIDDASGALNGPITLE